MKTSFVVAFGVGQSLPAVAAQITGQVKASNVPILERTLGYTKARIIATSPALRNKKEDLALYLEVKNSLPLKPPNERRMVTIHGQAFSPTITSCVVDEIVVFMNQDRGRVTLMINDQIIGSIEPREELSYKCETKGLGHVRLKDHVHARASVFVGTTGVAARPGPDGLFTLTAPEGTYELKVINEAGVIQSAPVEVGTEDVDMGLIGAEQTADEMPAEPESSSENATEAAAPPGPKIVVPPPVIPVPPPVIKPKPAAAAIPAMAVPVAPTPTPKAAATAPPAVKPPPPAVKPPPPAVTPPPPAVKPPPPAAKPPPAEEEEEDSLDDFFEMEE